MFLDHMRHLLVVQFRRFEPMITQAQTNREWSLVVFSKPHSDPVHLVRCTDDIWNGWVAQLIWSKNG